MPDLRTYAAWAAAGRSVRRGERAEFYRINPETHAGLAVFSEAQTQPLEVENVETWDLVDAATYRANLLAKGGPARVLADRQGDTYAFWVGTHAKLNAAFKEGGYTWNPVRWRWVSNPQVKYAPATMIEMIEKSPDYDLFREGELLQEVPQV